MRRTPRLKRGLRERYAGSMEINGIAHAVLTVSNFPARVAFYEPLLNVLGLTTVMKADGFLYCVGGRTAVGIAPAEDAYCGERFVQRRVGLHHPCFRARTREDVATVRAFVVASGATIVHPPEEGAWAPGYYSVLFEKHAAPAGEEGPAGRWKGTRAAQRPRSGVPSVILPSVKRPASPDALVAAGQLPVLRRGCR